MPSPPGFFGFSPPGWGCSPEPPPGFFGSFGWSGCLGLPLSGFFGSLGCFGSFGSFGCFGSLGTDGLRGARFFWAADCFQAASSSAARWLSRAARASMAGFSMGVEPKR